MNNYLLYIVGIICISVGISIIVIYSNLLVYGFGIGEFIKNIIKTWEFYLLPIGIFIIIKKDRF